MKDFGQPDTMASIHLLLASIFSLPTLPTCVPCSALNVIQGSLEEEHWEEVMNRGAGEFPAYRATCMTARGQS
jgi:hypothetical protein